MSDDSDIIGGVGLDGVAPGLFVGRGAEAARLADLLGLDASTPGDATPGDATSGDSGSGLVLLAGDAGIGKTRLLADAASRARAAGWTVLVGHCLGEAGRALPYLPFSEMLGRLETQDPTAVERILTVHPHLARLFPSRRRDLDIAGTIERAELVEASHAAFEDLARQGPVLLVVEDVHWADDSSRDLLTLLFTRGFAGRVSVVASYRSDDLHRRHPLRSTLAHWSRLGALHRIELEPLSDDAVRELIRGVQPERSGGGAGSAASDALSEDQVRAVVERAEGNAFFAEELVAASVLGRTGVAEDLSRLLLVRFDQLGASGQHVVRLASASGRQVTHALLASVAGLSDSELDEGLRDAVERHILVPTESGGYAFRHALLAETIYDDLLPGERVRAHERYADALTADRSLGPWADLARHATAAGRRELALGASIRAGDSALAMGGPQEAWQHYQLALSLMPDDHPDADRVSLRAAAAATAKGQALKGLELLQTRLARRGAHGDVGGRADLLAALAATARLTESMLDTLAMTKEGLSLLDASDEDHPAERARLLGAHVQALADRGRDEEAARAADEAIAAAEAAALPEVADEVRVVAARVLERAGDPEGSRVSLERIIAETGTAGDTAQVRAYHHLGSLHHRLGRLDRAMDVYLAGAEVGLAAGRRWAPYAFDCLLLAAVAAYEAGRWDEAVDLLEVGEDCPPQPAAALLTGVRLYVEAARGGSGWQAALAATRPWWDADGLVAVLAGSAAIDLHGAAGDLRGAISAHDDVVAELTRLWQPHFQAQLRIGALLLGQLGSHLQRTPTAERAELLARGRAAVEAGESAWELAAAAGQGGPESTAWRARLRAEGLRLRWLSAEPVESQTLVAAWQDAVELFDTYGHRYEAARSRARLGAALRAAGDPAAGPVLQAALDVARELGAEPLRAEIREAGGERPTVPRRPAERLGEALTAREREILTLVARGRSNREIGMQLFISAKTASVQVSNILAKLGAAGRGEAVALARERGWLD
ncbi:ATP-binding protein [Pedococcus sp.]|uniref:ATP-binding protein n=1 Tax=Pedococcus sp. TaxID=2860345 RepID=UPI002E0DD8F4|nr:AAA family ATPase [Pedococcus sp.]